MLTEGNAGTSDFTVSLRLRRTSRAGIDFLMYILGLILFSILNLRTENR